MILLIPSADMREKNKSIGLAYDHSSFQSIEIVQDTWYYIVCIQVK